MTKDIPTDDEILQKISDEYLAVDIDYKLKWHRETNVKNAIKKAIALKGDADKKLLAEKVKMLKDISQEIRGYGQDLRNDWSDFDGRDARKRLDAIADKIDKLFGTSVSDDSKSDSPNMDIERELKKQEAK